MPLVSRLMLDESFANPVRLQGSLRRIGIPRVARDRIVVGLKHMLAPGESARRATEAGKLPYPETVEIDALKRDGGGVVKAGKIPSAIKAAKVLERHFDKLKRDGALVVDPTRFKGTFLMAIIKYHELLAMPEVENFVLGDEIIALTSHYFGEIPVLSRLALYWSPQNKTRDESQLYHYDGEDRTQLKLLLAVKDVDADCGPFTYIPAPDSAKIAPTKRHSARLGDDMVETIAGSDAVRRAIGPQGTLFAIDTSRCLHYGSRGNSRERVMLFAQFTKFLAPKAYMPALHQNHRLVKQGHLEPGQRMLLNYPPTQAQ